MAVAARLQPMTKGCAIYYVGPVGPVGDEAVGPATATRMDKFVAPLLEQAGLLVMIGKAERGRDTSPSAQERQLF
jgi:fumarate hydratase class I